MSTIMLIRAGVTDYDDDHRLLGTLNVPLNSRGRQQIDEVIQQLQERQLNPELILGSPDDPAAESAKLLSGAIPTAKLKLVEELRNVNQGLWQGLPEDEVRARFPRIFRSGRGNPAGICAPEGESLADACRRIEGVLERAIRKYSQVAVLAPEPLATAVLCVLKGRPVRLTECLCGDESTAMFEVIEAGSFDAEAVNLNGNSQDNGLVVAGKGSHS